MRDTDRALVSPLTVDSTEDDLTAPTATTPGPTTFRSSTTAEGSGWVGLARLAPGVSWQEFRANVRDTVSDDPVRIVRGSAALDRCATLLGGAVIHPGRPGEFTVDLEPGRHVLFDYPDAAGADRPRYRMLSVEGRAEGEMPHPAGTIRAVAGPGFEVDDVPAAGSPLAFENTMPGRQFVESVLFPLPAAFGERELAGYFGRFRDGSSEWPSHPPFDLGAGAGCLPQSAGERAVLFFPELAAGRYVVVSWLKDARDGVRMAKRGQYRIVEIA